MYKLNLKIALRNLRRNKFYNVLNLIGLVIGLTVFVLVMTFVNHELAYDTFNPNHKNIYLVGRTVQERGDMAETSPPLAALIKNRCPEVVAVGRRWMAPFDVPIFSAHKKSVLKNYGMMDYDLAKMLQLLPPGFKPADNKMERILLLSKGTAKTLFPQGDDRGAFISIMQKGGRPAKIDGLIQEHDLPSNFNFESLFLSKSIVPEGKGYADPDFVCNTFIQVAPHTDIKALEQKISTAFIQDSKTVYNLEAGKRAIFLEPLSNLHLKPRFGSQAPYQLVLALSVLSIIVLVIVCINFANFTIIQASSRAKEVGVKKVLGGDRKGLIGQFSIEVILRCLIALFFALLLAEWCLPSFNQMFSVELQLWDNATQLLAQVCIAVLIMVLIAGIYPAVILSGFKPIAVLKSNLTSAPGTQLLRKTFLVLQFSIAILFAAGLLIINKQLQYMQTEDKNFEPSQVVFIPTVGKYERPEDFAPLRDRILKIKGVRYATIATTIPALGNPATNDYTTGGLTKTLNSIIVDYDYFKTLGIKLKMGRDFSRQFPTDQSLGIILNEAAVKAYGLANPLGAIIKNEGINYQVLGVVKDFKSDGFESAVSPTAFMINNVHAVFRMNMMLKIDQQEMQAALAALKKDWTAIDKISDSEFSYQFLDNIYGKLFVKQQQLKAAFTLLSTITIVIALMGVTAFAAYAIYNRRKEIAVRKVLGASQFDLLFLFNRYFIGQVLLANIIAWPLVYIISDYWLSTFYYRIAMPIWPYVLAGMLSIIITCLVVSLQALTGTRKSPVVALKYE